MIRPSWRVQWAVATVLASLLGACGTAAPTHAGVSAVAPVYAGPGPYVAGVTTLQMGESKVEVWYPAKPGAERAKPKDVYYLAGWLPSAIQAEIPTAQSPGFVTDAYRDIAPSKKGPFPLVLFSHGYASYRDQSTFLTTHLAQWGFVVAAPDVLSRGLASVFGQEPQVPLTDDQVLRETVELMDSESTVAGARLDGVVNTKRLAVMGYSSGGFDAIDFASQPDVKAYVSLASGAQGDNGQSVLPPDKPSLYMVGQADHVVPEADVLSTYHSAPAPKRFVTFARAGHLAFTDVCLIGSSQGGVLTIARTLGITVPENLLPLATDGCLPGSLPVRKSYPVINSFVTADLLHALGVNRSPVGLSNSAAHAFPGVDVTYLHTP